MNTYIFIHSFFQVIANTLLLLSANLIGYYYQFMSSKSQKRTFEQIRSTVESRVKLECEKEHQEQLLLSVIPAYIAAEVCTLSVYFIVPRLNNSLLLPWPGFFTIRGHSTTTWTEFVPFLTPPPTVAINELLCMKNAGAQIAMDFS